MAVGRFENRPGIRNEGRRLAIVENVNQLVALRGWIDRHKHGRRFESGKNGHNRLDAVVQADTDAIASLYAACDEGVGEAIRHGLEIAIRETLLAADEGGFVGKTLSRQFEEISDKGKGHIGCWLLIKAVLPVGLRRNFAHLRPAVRVLDRVPQRGGVRG